MGALGKNEMEYKRGRRGAYHIKGQPMTTKEKRKKPSLNKTTKFSTLQGMDYLGEKEENRNKAFFVWVLDF